MEARKARPVVVFDQDAVAGDHLSGSVEAPYT
jgi:hypothetical protein